MALVLKYPRVMRDSIGHLPGSKLIAIRIFNKKIKKLEGRAEVVINWDIVWFQLRV